MSMDRFRFCRADNRLYPHHIWGPAAAREENFPRARFRETALREDTQQWWADTLARDPAELEEEEEPFTADLEGLRRFLEGEVLPWFEARKKELANRPLIREQAQAGAARPLRGPSRPKVRTDAGHVAAPQGPATGSDRGLIRFAKPMAVASCTRWEGAAREVHGQPL